MDSKGLMGGTLDAAGKSAEPTPIGSFWLKTWAKASQSVNEMKNIREVGMASERRRLMLKFLHFRPKTKPINHSIHIFHH